MTEEGSAILESTNGSYDPLECWKVDSLFEQHSSLDGFYAQFLFPVRLDPKGGLQLQSSTLPSQAFPQSLPGVPQSILLRICTPAKL